MKALKFKLHLETESSILILHRNTLISDDRFGVNIRFRRKGQSRTSNVWVSIKTFMQFHMLGWWPNIGRGYGEWSRIR
jgi:hypothetical protein